MAEHRFSVGQLVRMKPHSGSSLRTTEMVQITGRLPPNDRSPQYRMRNESERHERVSTEDLLEEITLTLPAAHRQSS